MSVPPPMKSVSGVARIGRAFGCSMEGLAAAYRYEAAFRQELLLVSAGLVVAVVVPASLTQRALLVGALLSVLVVELLNSAVEATVDLVSPELHELAKRAKDVASAAVFVSLFGAAVTWALVLVDIAT
jgi:diacylglycerol kinase (ATP)